MRLRVGRADQPGDSTDGRAGSSPRQEVHVAISGPVFPVLTAGFPSAVSECRAATRLQGHISSPPPMKVRCSRRGFVWSHGAIIERPLNPSWQVWPPRSDGPVQQHVARFASGLSDRERERRWWELPDSAFRVRQFTGSGEPEVGPCEQCRWEQNRGGRVTARGLHGHRVSRRKGGELVFVRADPGAHFRVCQDTGDVRPRCCPHQVPEDEFGKFVAAGIGQDHTWGIA